MFDSVPDQDENQIAVKLWKDHGSIKIDSLITSQDIMVKLDSKNHFLGIKKENNSTLIG